jgi:hypothetical protein
MKTLPFIFLRSFLMALFLGCLPIYSATLCVRPTSTGNASGSDWTNALGPAFTPARGNTYYFAGGSYSSGFTLSVADSGTTAITFKKATVADHGTATGWSDTYGTTQAVLGYVMISTDYWIFDGQSRDSAWYNGVGNFANYGFRINNLRMDVAMSVAANHCTFQYVDIEGGGRDTGAGDDVVYGLYGYSYNTWQYCALHDSDRCIFLMRGGCSNNTVQYCYLGRNHSCPATHAEMLSTTDGNNNIFRFNIFEDIEGTAVFAFLNNGTANGWEIYGNVLRWTQNYYANVGRTDSNHNVGTVGMIYVANDASQSNSLNNLKFYNNTIYRAPGTASGVHIESGAGNVAYNCIWYNCVDAAFLGVTTGSNWYYGTTHSTDSSNVQAGATGVFVSTTDPTNLRLTSATTAGTSFSSPYNVDMDGTVRGADGVWDRGAYEYSTGNTEQPPSNAITQILAN